MQKETVGLAKGGEIYKPSYQSTPTKSEGVENNPPLPKGWGPEAEPEERIPTLSDIGIDYKLSSRAQKMAAVPEERKRPCGRASGGGKNGLGE